MSLVHQDVLRDAIAEVSHFRSELYACMTARGDALFELCDALLCTDGSVRTLVDLALAPEHRRGHGALYGGLNQDRIDVATTTRCRSKYASSAPWSGSMPCPSPASSSCPPTGSTARRTAPTSHSAGTPSCCPPSSPT
ncbi:transposase [Streptomyces niveus]